MNPHTPTYAVQPHVHAVASALHQNCMIVPYWPSEEAAAVSIRSTSA